MATFTAFPFGKVFRWLFPDGDQRCGIASLLTLSLLVSVVSTPARAEIDRLRVAALPSEKAGQSLMLDVTQAGDRLVAVGDRGYVLLSDDGGDSWRQAPVPVSVALTSVFFVDAREGWAVGHAGAVLHTRDGGEHWQLQLDGERINRAVVKYYQQQVAAQETLIEQLADEAREAAELALEALRFKLDDAEAALEEGPTKPLLDLWFKNAREGLVVGAYGTILKTDDGGESWLPLMAAVPNPDGFHYNQLAEIGGEGEGEGKSKVLVMVGEAGSLYRSLDDGESWDALDSPYDGSLFGLQPLGDGQSLLVYGLRGNAFRSANLGDSWEPVSMPGRESIMASLPLGGGALLMGGGGSVWRSAESADRFDPVRVPRALPITAAAWAGPKRVVVTGYGGVRMIDVPVSAEEG